MTKLRSKLKNISSTRHCEAGSRSDKIQTGFIRCLFKCGHSFGFEKDNEENMSSMSWIGFKIDISFQENKDDNQNISRTILTQTGKNIIV